MHYFHGTQSLPPESCRIVPVVIMCGRHWDVTDAEHSGNGCPAVGFFILNTFTPHPTTHLCVPPTCLWASARLSCCVLRRRHRDGLHVFCMCVCCDDHSRRNEQSAVLNEWPYPCPFQNFGCLKKNHCHCPRIRWWHSILKLMASKAPLERWMKLRERGGICLQYWVCFSIVLFLFSFLTVRTLSTKPYVFVIQQCVTIKL